MLGTAKPQLVSCYFPFLYFAIATFESLILDLHISDLLESITICKKFPNQKFMKILKVLQFIRWNYGSDKK